MELPLEDFLRSYKFLRRYPELGVGDWDLYKQTATNKKVFVKEIQFSDEQESKFFIQGVLETSQNKLLRGCLVNFLNHAVKRIMLGAQQVFNVYLIYEYYEMTLDKLVNKKIKESDSLTPKDLYTL